jgi:hypothetical protein
MASLSTQSSLLAGKEPVLSEEQREALNTALSGAFSSLNSLSKEDSKEENARQANDQELKLTLKGVPPPLERKGSRKAHVGSGSSGSHPKVYHDHHLSRKTKGSGKAKKGGGGGKFTWGSMFENQSALEYQPSLDKNDPNWDSSDELLVDDGSISLVEAKLVDIAAYKDSVLDILVEYFVSGTSRKPRRA